MASENLFDLAKRLAEMTSKEKIKWVPGLEEGSYDLAASDYIIRTSYVPGRTLPYSIVLGRVEDGTKAEGVRGDKRDNPELAKLYEVVREQVDGHKSLGEIDAWLDRLDSKD